MVGAIEAALSALNAAQVRYLVVGGVAVVLHGHLRTTANLDLVVQLTTDNALRAERALATLGYRPRARVPLEQFADPAIRGAWARDKGLSVFGLWSEQFPGLEIDLFVTEPFDFDVVHGRAKTVMLDQTTATVVALDDLLDLKAAAGRPVNLSLGHRGVACVGQRGRRLVGANDDGFTRGFDGHRLAQARMALRLTPAERLRWLETTMETLRRWRGRAREKPASPARKPG